MSTLYVAPSSSSPYYQTIDIFQAAVTNSTDHDAHVRLVKGIDKRRGNGRCRYVRKHTSPMQNSRVTSHTPTPSTSSSIPAPYLGRRSVYYCPAQRQRRPDDQQVDLHGSKQRIRHSSTLGHP